MTDAWDEKRKAQEEEYFQRKNKEALLRMKGAHSQERLSPITGKPMEKITVMGVVIDRCTESGGIWLDAGELEQLITASRDQEVKDNWVERFFGQLFKTKS